MLRLVERASRLVAKPQSISALLLVVSITTTPADSTRREAGYAGVLPLPIEVGGDVTVLGGKPEQPLERRDARTERGRVLYAAGHAPNARSSSVSGAARPPRSAGTCPPPPPGSRARVSRATSAVVPSPSSASPSPSF